MEDLYKRKELGSNSYLLYYRHWSYLSFTLIREPLTGNRLTRFQCEKTREKYKKKEKKGATPYCVQRVEGYCAVSAGNKECRSQKPPSGRFPSPL
ncbi:hypothetical protein AVEN_253441-1 [Araneus ventricosus]|uniref:Uncharacterized protein n=1 Tax=Araneus ventricosus TaxID=182803 RepID=A0A4Y2L0G2_ARAVE|nr:hypothetical protein AVEN_253441-1 [Araneus ventricosus]